MGERDRHQILHWRQHYIAFDPRLSYLLPISLMVLKTHQRIAHVDTWVRVCKHSKSGQGTMKNVMKDVWPTHLVCKDSDFLFLGRSIFPTFGWLCLKHFDPLAWQVLAVQCLYGFHCWLFVCVLSVTVVTSYRRGKRQQKNCCVKSWMHSFVGKMRDRI